MKKFIILFLVVAVIAMFGLPAALFANGENYAVTVIKTSTGFDSGDFTFDLWVYNPFETEYEKLSSDTIGHGGGSTTFNFASGNTPPVLVKIVESGTNGATGVEWNLCVPATATDGIVSDTVSFSLSLSPGNTQTVYFDNLKLKSSKPKPEPEVWVRTMPMTCYQVWINEDNMFEMVFWYPCKNNNWVRIYDMEGNMVYEVDVPLNNPHIVVDLPDGMYMVKIFWLDQEKPNQEFLIGKP